MRKVWITLVGLAMAGTVALAIASVRSGTEGFRFAPGKWSEANPQRVARTETRNIPLKGVSHLRIEDGNGNVTVRTSPGGDMVAVTASLFGHWPDTSEGPTWKSLVEDGTLTISSDRESSKSWHWGNHRGIHYDVIVPVGHTLKVDIDGGKGDVKVQSVSGPLHVESGVGKVLVTGGSGDVTIESGVGDVSLEDRTGGSVQVHNGTGAIHLTAHTPPTGDVSLETGVGAIEADLPQTSDLRMKLSAGLGHVKNELGGSTSGDETKVNKGTHAFEASAGTGNIEVRAIAETETGR